MIPEVVNIGGFVAVTIEALAVIIGVIIGGFFAFLVVKKCLKWGNQLDGSSSSFNDKDYDCSPEAYKEMRKQFYGYHTDGTPIGNPDDEPDPDDDDYESSTRVTRTVVFRKME
jgi:hypothetical protein